MNKLLLVSLLFLTNYICAQESSRIDSIENALKNAPASEQYDLHVEAIKETYKSNPEKALEHWKEISSGSLSKYRETQSNYYAGKIYYNLKDYKTSYEFYEKSLALKNEVQDLEFIIKSNVNIIRFHRDRALFDEAHEKAQRALSFFQSKNDAKGIYKIYQEIGLIEYYMGKIQSAGSYFEKAIKYIPEGNNTDKAGLLMNIGVINYKIGNSEKSLEFYDQALEIFLEEKDSTNIANVYVNQAITHDRNGAYKQALDEFNQALKIYQGQKNRKSEANTLESIGLIYSSKGNHEKSLEIAYEVLDIREEIKDTILIANSYTNLSNIYGEFNDTVSQLKFLKKALAINLKAKNLSSIANNYSALGNFYYSTNHQDSALYYFRKTASLAKEIGSSRVLLSTYLGLGNTYKKMEDLDSSLYYYELALPISKSSGNTTNYAGLLSNIGVVYYDLGQYRKAISYYDKSLKIRKESGIKKGIYESYLTLANAYGKLGQYKDAYENLNLHVELKDSVFNNNMAEKIAEMRTLYQTEKTQDSLKIATQQVAFEKEEKEATENKNKALLLEKRSQQIIIIGIGLGLALALVLVFFVYKRNQEKKKANKVLSQKNYEITEQKDIIEEKNKEITDSIQYAKRIQSAILPPQKIIDQSLKNHFILYKPKDIVAGDFYWMETIKNGSEEQVLIAAADCTGHGVPGAMVSVVCNNALNRSVREFGLSSPAKILDKTREIVVQEFEQSEDDVKDGMDIALCALRSHSHSQTVLQYAGANNPLWIVRHESEEVEEIKANKQPIGNFENPKPFDEHQVQVNKGDTVYLFSDGFADQFGGDKGKKMKTKGLKTLLLSIKGESMFEQKKLLNEQFEKWRGNMEQLDDVCIIGMRF